MKAPKLVSIIMIYSCAFSYSSVEDYDLEFRYATKLTCENGSVSFNPIIRGGDDFSVIFCFEFELWVDSDNGARRWVKFSRNGRDLIDAMSKIDKLKYNEVVEVKNLIILKKSKSTIYGTIYRKRAEGFVPFSFVCRLDEAVEFGMNLRKRNSWIADKFEKIDNRPRRK